ncbi:MAG TPA: hypothetical protein VG324_06535 [Blastocatellia bacterium]|nr:hypothetical protein [Blastocatellia bacterium]
MTGEPDKAGESKKRPGEGTHTMKRILACVFGLLILGCIATLPPPGNLAVLIALSSPTPTLISEFEPKKAAKKAKK